jgi:hypothetical protein
MHSSYPYKALIVMVEWFHKNNFFFITLVEGLAIYINIIAHPELQPALSALITILAAIGSGLAVWYVTRVRGMKLA